MKSRSFLPSLTIAISAFILVPSVAIADQVGSGSASIGFDLATIGAITPLSGLNASFGNTETYNEVLSLPSNSPGSSLSWAINPLGTPSPDGRAIQGTNLDIDAGNVLGSWGGGTDLGVYLLGGEQIGFGGATRWDVNPLLGGGTFVLGDFALRYSASRVGGGRSGLVITNSYGFADVAIFDIANASISVTGSVLSITGDILISDGLLAVGFPSGSYGADIGDFALSANLVPAPGALAALALAPLAQRRRRR